MAFNRESALLCDISRGVLYRYTPSTDDHECVYEAERAIGGFTIQTDGSLLLFESGGRVEQWHNGTIGTVVDSIPGVANSRFNDVIADPQGRVYAGTMPTDARMGDLYRFDQDGSFRVVASGFDIPNGMAFTQSLETLYLTESEEHTIHQYDYALSTGELSNRQRFLETPDEPGVPDGMTIDSSGGIWSARWNGNALHRYNSSGGQLETIKFPVCKVASVTFGGEEYSDVYVTTAGGDNRDEEGSLAGSVFRLDVGITGSPEFRSKIPVKSGLSAE